MWHGGVGQAWREEVTSYYSFEIVSRLMSLLDARASRVAAELDVEQLDLMPQLERSLRTYYDVFHLTPAGARAVAALVTAAMLQPPTAAWTAAEHQDTLRARPGPSSRRRTTDRVTTLVFVLVLVVFLAMLPRWWRDETRACTARRWSCCSSTCFSSMRGRRRCIQSWTSFRGRSSRWRRCWRAFCSVSPASGSSHPLVFRQHALLVAYVCVAAVSTVAGLDPLSSFDAAHRSRKARPPLLRAEPRPGHQAAVPHLHLAAADYPPQARPASHSGVRERSRLCRHGDRDSQGPKRRERISRKCRRLRCRPVRRSAAGAFRHLVGTPSRSEMAGREYAAHVHRGRLFNRKSRCLRRNGGHRGRHVVEDAAEGSRTGRSRVPGCRGPHARTRGLLEPDGDDRRRQFHCRQRA